jgi:hypothetical protein
MSSNKMPNTGKDLPCLLASLIEVIELVEKSNRVLLDGYIQKNFSCFSAAKITDHTGYYCGY